MLNLSNFFPPRFRCGDRNTGPIIRLLIIITCSGNLGDFGCFHNCNRGSCDLILEHGVQGAYVGTPHKPRLDKSHHIESEMVGTVVGERHQYGRVTPVVATPLVLPQGGCAQRVNSVAFVELAPRKRCVAWRGPHTEVCCGCARIYDMFETVM